MNRRVMISVLAFLAWQAPYVHAQAPGGPAPFGKKVADAAPNELRVIASGSLQRPLESVRMQAEQAAQRPLAIQYGAARGGLRDEILAGQEFEVALLVPDVNKELVQQGKALAQTYEVARIPVAIGLRGEGAPPDVSSPAAIKKALLGAKSVRYQPGGAGWPTMNKILSSLGIADSIKDATKMGGPSGAPVGPPPGAGAGPGAPGAPMTPALAAGEYEIWVFPVSEILSNRALKNLGPVIPEFQVPVITEAVIGAHARDKKAAQAFIDFLRGPTFELALKESGMTKGQ